jgi:hypothetical protein
MAKSTKTKGRGKVPVTERALFQRINRKLAHENEQLKTCRGGQWENELGRYYVVDLNRNSITASDVDPEALGRELGVLARWEEIKP